MVSLAEILKSSSNLPLFHLPILSLTNQTWKPRSSFSFCALSIPTALVQVLIFDLCSGLCDFCNQSLTLLLIYHKFSFKNKVFLCEPLAPQCPQDKAWTSVCLSSLISLRSILHPSPLNHLPSQVSSYRLLLLFLHGSWLIVQSPPVPLSLPLVRVLSYWSFCSDVFFPIKTFSFSAMYFQPAPEGNNCSFICVPIIEHFATTR